MPDEQAVVDAAEENGKYLNFISNTLEGDPITTAVFYDYDMTVVNFWASYCEEEGINELDTLQAFYKDLQKKYPNVNFIQVVIDTPGEKAEKVVADAYKKAGVTFTGIMPDQNLAGWIMNNLNGLPTTIFVDSKGKPAELKIEGIQDASYYMETTETMLQSAGSWD
ncbi:MAG: TlpA family protein disulfide reductase, partial [Anaerotignum sp.]